MINGSPAKQWIPAIQSLTSDLGEPAAVIHISPWRGSSAPTTTAATCSSCPALGSVFSHESKVMSFKVAPSSPVHSPMWWGKATTTSMLGRRSSHSVALSVHISKPHPRSFSFSASETCDVTAAVLSVISSAPHTLGGCRESMEPSRCHDCVCGTMVTQVLDCTPALAWRVYLICRLVWVGPSTALWSASSGCPSHVALLLHPCGVWWFVLPDVLFQVTWKASVS